MAQGNFDIIDEVLVIMGDYHAGVWKYAGVRTMIRDGDFPELLEAQDAVIEAHLAHLMRSEADKYAWTLQMVETMAIAPEDDLRRALAFNELLFHLVVVAHALCEFSERPSMYARISELLDRDPDNE